MTTTVFASIFDSEREKKHREWIFATDQYSTGYVERPTKPEWILAEDIPMRPIDGPGGENPFVEPKSSPFSNADQPIDGPGGENPYDGGQIPAGEGGDEIEAIHSGTLGGIIYVDPETGEAYEKINIDKIVSSDKIGIPPGEDYYRLIDDEIGAIHGGTLGGIIYVDPETSEAYEKIDTSGLVDVHAVKEIERQSNTLFSCGIPVNPNMAGKKDEGLLLQK